MTAQHNYELERRQFSFRADSVDAENGIVRGIAVPYGVTTRIRDWAGEYDEQFARGSVDDAGALAFWRHDEPIGSVRSSAEGETGRVVEMHISQTAQGRDALILARDLQQAGRPLEMSVGFEPGGDYTVEERDGDVPVITRTRVRVREVSLVPFGAYGEGASVTEVREDRNRKEQPVTNPTVAPAGEQTGLLEVRQSVEELERRVNAIPIITTPEPTADTRSAGEIVQALAAGDEATIRQYNTLMERAYTGGTSADSPIVDGWVGDLTRIFDASSGVLARVFSEDTLPQTGMNIEFAELATNTVAFDQQVAEGDNLAFGKVTLTTRTAPVNTYGGYTQLTRQQIERSTLPILNRSLEALTLAAGARSKVVLRTAYDTLYAARTAIAANGGVVLLGATLAASTLTNWTSSIIDAAIKFELENLEIEHLVVSTSVFKKFDSLVDTTGRSLFDRTGDGSNSTGVLRIPGLEGNLAGIHVACDTGAAGDKAAFTNSRAIRHYKNSVVSLQDENIINLSKDFSAYRYGAVAAEIPAAVVPVKLAAA